MPEAPREIEIETLNTPKGDVPTVKGLETAINAVYAEMASLDKHLSQMSQFQSQITQSLTQINSHLDKNNEKIVGLGETFASLIVHLAKIESQQEQKRELSRKQLLIEKADLIALKEDLSSILEKLKDHVTENEP
ncbi:MAG: hypothetical protein ACXADY_11475 [Candidatus Hodarchaeales archaeon]|jgi:chromosome segregation ATPase